MTRAASLALCLLAGSLSVNAATMRFEDIAPPEAFVLGVTPYTEAGFTLTNSLGPESQTDGLFDSECLVNDNGTDFFGWCANSYECPSIVITLTENSGATFNFIKFDSSVINAGIGPNIIEVVGTLAAGGTISAIIRQTDEWTTYVLGWQGVNRVDFIPGPGHTDFPDHAIDNLVMTVRATRAIPAVPAQPTYPSATKATPAIRAAPPPGSQ